MLRREATEIVAVPTRCSGVHRFVLKCVHRTQILRAIIVTHAIQVMHVLASLDDGLRMRGVPYDVRTRDREATPMVYRRWPQLRLLCGDRAAHIAALGTPLASTPPRAALPREPRQPLVPSLLSRSEARRLATAVVAVSEPRGLQLLADRSDHRSAAASTCDLRHQRDLRQAPLVVALRLLARSQGHDRILVGASA